VETKRVTAHKRRRPVGAWTRNELDKISAAEELKLAAARRDGSLNKPVTIWVVRIDDELYVRSGYGRTSAWFRSSQMRREGRIRAGGIEKDVSFLDADKDLGDEIDAAYHAKYCGHGAQYVNMMVSPEARSATIKLAPREASS
jgi:hypothetical protein